ncbi:PilZ domain-containing protein [Sphingomonas turrisvirgatae]|uniref:PilZ domain protein n=1 Tax=Sphingomonas turrisvirgatae TaxID=1888892 RepID=A0A1E3LXT2_9SPHN|nr:PilZ domain-containing protein [Sphingomonas turrisvirgatae]ODP38533.1 pilZ domain protein [Sphingomonas turrisvirgatae]
MDQLSTDPLTGVAAADDAASQRNGARDSLLLSAQLQADDGVDLTVRVRNLSSGGLMAEYAAPIARGAPVKVDVRGVGWVKGHIAWTAEGRIGIAFEREIDPLAARKPVSGRASATATPLRRAL